MIHHIVFDMGNVLVDYRPMEYTQRFFSDPAEATLVCRELFDGPEWPLLDEGKIEPEVALAQVCGRLPKNLQERAKELFHHWFDQLTIIPETNELGQRLKQKGYGLYILSNPAYSFHQYAHKIPLFPLLNGYIVSADEKLVKPNVAIYQLLCKRYQLEPEECFFIDDRAENVEAARQCGMYAYQYQSDVQALYSALQRAGVNI